MNIKTAHSVYTQAGTQPIAAEFQYVPLQIASRIPPSLMTVWFSSLDPCRLANMKISETVTGRKQYVQPVPHLLGRDWHMYSSMGSLNIAA